jgi:hypothetical protein
VENENGNPTRKDNGVESRPVDTVILTYDRATDHLDVGGTFNSVDLALDMLERARRALDAKLRLQQALALQQQLAEQRQNAAIAESLRNRR